jgi:HSP20 family protein
MIAHAYFRRDPFAALFNDVLGVRAARVAPVRAIRFDVSEHDDTYVVRADLPGFAKDEIEVAIDGARVTVRAESKPVADATPAAGNLLYTERIAGRAERSFELAVDIDQARADASYENGVLTLKLPKKVAESRKLLAIR